MDTGRQQRPRYAARRAGKDVDIILRKLYYTKTLVDKSNKTVHSTIHRMPDETAQFQPPFKHCPISNLMSSRWKTIPDSLSRV